MSDIHGINNRPGSTQEPAPAPAKPQAPATSSGAPAPTTAPADQFQATQHAPASAEPALTAPAHELSAFLNPAGLPDRFAQEVALLKQQLLLAGADVPASVAQKVTELFDAYASRILELARAKAALPPGAEPLLAQEEAVKVLTRAAVLLVQKGQTATGGHSDEFAQAAERFLGALKGLGYDVDRARVALNGQRGAGAAAQGPAPPPPGAKDLPSARAVEQASQRAAVEGVQKGDTGAAKAPEKPIIAAPGSAEKDSTQDEPDFADRLATIRGRLSPQTLWNVLHTFRGTEEDSVERKDQWNRVMVIALLVLAGVFIGVMVLVNL